MISSALLDLPQVNGVAYKRVRFVWPPNHDIDKLEEYFVGFWHPLGSGPVEMSLPGEQDCQAIEGLNWAFLSSRSTIHENRPSLIDRDGPAGAFAFRGYLLEPPVHSYSPKGELLRNLPDPKRTSINGLFAVARVSGKGDSLTLMTDYLGIANLYFRRVGDGIAFATNPRHLAMEGDQPDLLAWRSMLESGFLSSDRTLDESIKCLPAGHYLRADQNGFRTLPWFDFNSIDEGRDRINAGSLRQIEDAFDVAMQRCHRLANGETILPLSSGHDSRRMLAWLHREARPFRAITARVFQKGDRDLDARYAAEMASHFGFAHSVVEPASVERYVVADRIRRTLCDGESIHHTWAVDFAAALPARPTLVLEGLLGDILGNPGFRMPGMYRSPHKDIEMILDESTVEATDRWLLREYWPSKEQYRDDVRSFLEPFSHRHNVAEFAFILLRQRRMNSSRSQRLFRPGHLVVLPYADLDYVKKLLSYRPADKHRIVLQRACLHEFARDFANFPGNRDIPLTMPPGSPNFYNKRILACHAEVRRELERRWSPVPIDEMLTLGGRAAILLSEHHAKSMLSHAWPIVPLFEMVSRQIRRQRLWRLDS